MSWPILFMTRKYPGQHPWQFRIRSDWKEGEFYLPASRVREIMALKDPERALRREEDKCTARKMKQIENDRDRLLLGRRS